MSDSRPAEWTPLLHRILVLVLAAIPAASLADESGYCDDRRGLNAPFASSPESDGSADEPHRICTLRQLRAVSDDPAGHYVLMADIHAGSTRRSGPDPWQGDGGWSPLFGPERPFRGVFDGSGHFIQNLKSWHPGQDHVGLFGASRGATFRNLELRRFQVAGRSRVGALVGTADSDDAFRGTTIENVTAGGLVVLSGPDERLSGAGGLVGELGSYGKIRGGIFRGEIRSRNGSQVLRVGGLAGRMGLFARCEQSRSLVRIDLATRSGDGYVVFVGGIVGETTSFGAIERCHATSPGITVRDVDFGEGIGGVVGNTGSRTTILLSSSRSGAIDAPDAYYVGGFVGRAYDATITESLATTRVRGEIAGGFVGNVGDSVSISDCFSTGDVVGGVAGGFLGSLEYECNNDIGNSYASGDVVGGSGFVGSVESNDGECNGLAVFTSFSTGRSVNFSPRIFYRDAYFFRDNYWYSADAIDPQRCGASFGRGECAAVSSPDVLWDPAHPVYTSGAAPWDFDDVWQAVPGRLPVLRKLARNAGGNADRRPREDHSGLN